jgi:hypothetical protein
VSSTSALARVTAPGQLIDDVDEVDEALLVQLEKRDINLVAVLGWLSLVSLALILGFDVVGGAVEPLALAVLAPVVTAAGGFLAWRHRKKTMRELGVTPALYQKLVAARKRVRRKRLAKDVRSLSADDVSLSASVNARAVLAELLAESDPDAGVDDDLLEGPGEIGGVHGVREP